MARIRPVDLGVDPADLDQGMRVQLGVGGIISHRPEIAAGLGAVTDAINHNGTLPRRLIELIRLRIAFHNQCRSCMAIRYDEAVQDGVTEELVCSLERPAEADDLTDAERAALASPTCSRPTTSRSTTRSTTTCASTSPKVSSSRSGSTVRSISASVG